MGEVRSWLALAMALAIATAAQAATFDASVLDRFVPGQTTKAQARHVLGEPSAEAPSLNQHTTLIYQYEAPPDPAGAGPAQLYVVLLFDPAGKFVRYRAYRKTADAQPAAGSPPPAAAPGARATPSVGIDPFDAGAVRSMNWEAIEQSPLWIGAAAAGRGDQTLEQFPYRTDRKTSAVVAGLLPAQVRLETARNGSGRHRIVVSRVIGAAGECQSLRATLTQTYGPPTATLRTHFRSPVGQDVLSLSFDYAQWPAGATEITQLCRTVGLAGKTIPGWDLQLEPAVGAPPVAPLFALDCPGLAAAPNSASTLTFDPREQLVREGGETGNGLATAAISDAEITFKLSGGRMVRIDRRTGGYTVDAPQGAAGARQGVCVKAAPPE